MRVNRRFLNWGVFLVAIGGVLVAADLAAVDSATIADALRLWPLAIIAIGIGLILRRTRFSVAGGLLAAAIPGLLLGGALAVVPHFSVDCGGRGEPASIVDQHTGRSTGRRRSPSPAAAGRSSSTPRRADGWAFTGGNSANRPPVVDATAQSLSIDSGIDRRLALLRRRPRPAGT